MTRLSAIASAVLLFAAASGHAANQVIDFEDLPTPSTANSAIAPPVGYRGYVWGTYWAVSQVAAGWFFGSPQTHSGINFGWESGANPLELSAVGGGAFDFVSFWGRDGSGVDTIVAHGYRNGAETYTRTFNVTDTYALVTLGFVGIDRLVIDAPIANTGIRNLLLDDITITAAVPEPASLALFGAGLGVVVAAALRRRSAAARKG